jgi:hypothetical protein
MELQIHRRTAEPIALLAGREEDELEWLAGVLRQELGVPAAWTGKDQEGPEAGGVHRPASLQLPGYPIEVRASAGTLRLDWDNRKMPKDQGITCSLTVFWLIWAPLTVYVTVLLIVNCVKPDPNAFFLAVWCVFGWLGTLGIPYGFCQRRWSEWIEISKENITCGWTGRGAPRAKSFSMQDLRELYLGHYGQQGDTESTATLNLLTARSIRGRRVLIGYWLAPHVKGRLYDLIADFVREQEIPLRLRRD